MYVSTSPFIGENWDNSGDDDDVDDGDDGGDDGDDGGDDGDDGGGDDVDDGGQVSGRVCPEQGATSSAPQGRNPRWMFTMVILLLIMTVTQRGWGI